MVKEGSGLSEADALELAVKAVEIYAARHPRPPHVTITQAAAMLGRSRPTMSQILKGHRVKLNGCGLIPIEAVDKLLVSRGRGHG
ncbi:DNA-binding protein [Paraburkholderia caledonica]|nr:DNA-binding protein [Paraburkholderia caledonica]